MGIYILKQPPETGIDLDLWAQVAAHPNVSYVKDSSMAEDYGRALLEIKAKRPGLTLRTGYEFDVLSSIANGYDGCLLGTAILNAGFITRAVAALQVGDKDAARAWQERSNRLLYDLFRPDISSWMSGLKYALRRLGIISTEFSHLVYPLNDEDRRRFDAAKRRGELTSRTRIGGLIEIHGEGGRGEAREQRDHADHDEQLDEGEPSVRPRARHEPP